MRSSSCGCPVFELDVTTLGRRGTEALSDLQRLLLLYESECATLASKAIGIFFFFLKTLPVIGVEIAR